MSYSVLVETGGFKFKPLGIRIPKRFRRERLAKTKKEARELARLYSGDGLLRTKILKVKEVI